MRDSSGGILAGPDRVLRSRQAARQAYDRLSGWYDWLAASEAHFGAQALRLLAVQPGESVLEIGSGTGRHACSLAAQVGPDGRVLGADLSAGMARQALRRARGSQLAGALALAQADAAALPCPNSCFDAALAAFTLELFDTGEIPAVLAELRRALRPGGRLAVAAMSFRSPPGPAARLYGWFHQRYPAWADCRPIPAGEWLRQAGFRVLVRQSGSLWGLPVDIILAQSPGY